MKELIGEQQAMKQAYAQLHLQHEALQASHVELASQAGHSAQSPKVVASGTGQGFGFGRGEAGKLPPLDS